jgi:hypothetical protein
MNNAIDSYSVIHNNPFTLAPLFREFYSTVARAPKNLLLSYLVLPLVLYPESRRFLTNANKTSSIRTMRKEHGRFYGLPERVHEYRSLTNLCIQYATDLGALDLNNDLSVVVNGHNLDTALCPGTSPKAARNLGKLLRPYDPPAVYRLLGVTSL